jgi:AcrR family transcriptional regulator
VTPDPLRAVRRADILDAMTTVVSERGFATTSVAAVCAQAGISRQAFYREFQDLRQCFRALLDDGYRHTFMIVSDAFQGAASWREGLLEALAGLLLYFDSEPQLARIWLVDFATAGSWVLEYRERKLAVLTAQIIDHWDASPDAGSHPLAAETVMISVLGTIQRHLVSDTSRPLISLLGDLMGIATTPYLSVDEVSVEIERGNLRSRRLAGAAPSVATSRATPTLQLPSLLLNPRARRARQCLLYLATHPGASNREIASGIGISNHAQVATLLGRLQSIGLLAKRPGRPGYPNAWTLTSFGSVAADAIAQASLCDGR